MTDPTEQVAEAIKLHGWYFVGNLGVGACTARRLVTPWIKESTE